MECFDNMVENSFAEQPVSKFFSTLGMSILKSKSPEQLQSMPIASSIMSWAGYLGVYKADTQEVDIEGLFAGLKGCVKDGRLTVGPITIKSEELNLWAKKLQEAEAPKDNAANAANEPSSPVMKAGEFG
jgi:hypothetical protein